MAMKRTLLEMTQDILVSLDGEEVSAITDTAESAQVAAIIRQCFYEIVSDYELPEHYTFFELTETSSASPVIMTKPSDVITISWIKYDYGLAAESVKNYTEVKYLPRNTFFNTMDDLVDTDTDVGTFNYTIGSDIFPFKYRNDLPPRFYTTYDDNTIVFDSFDEAEETFLRKTKTWCWGLKEQSWSHTDSAVPALDHKLHNLLFQKAKAQCFMELKQAENPSAERKARRAEHTLVRKKHDVNADNVWYYYNERQLPNFGRK